MDSAVYGEIKFLYDRSICDGITTNPSLLNKAVGELKKKGKKIDLEDYIKDILKIAKGTPVSLEVTKTDVDGMVEEGRRIYRLFNPVANNVFVKIPVNPSFKINSGKDFDGLEAIKELSKLNIPVNATLIFTPEQALMAAKSGAKFVSPFAGRIDDYIREKNKIKFSKENYFPKDGLVKKNKVLNDNGVVSGVDLVRQIVNIFKEYNINSEVLAASIRNSRQFREMALVGADIVTLPFDVFRSLLWHDKTVEGMKRFTEDAPEEYKRLIR